MSLRTHKSMKSLLKSQSRSTLGLRKHRHTPSLDKSEVYWRDHYTWFLEQGYKLPARYNPDWTASAAFTAPTTSDTVSISSRLADWEESAIVNSASMTVPALQVPTGRKVLLKRVLHDASPDEVPILTYFSRIPLNTDTRNHCIPILGVLRPPSTRTPADPEKTLTSSDHLDELDVVAVLPTTTAFNDPEFDTIGEAVDFIRQILRGFRFLHHHRVAHRDIRIENLVLETNSVGSYSHKHKHKHSNSANAPPPNPPNSASIKSPTNVYSTNPNGAISHRKLRKPAASQGSPERSRLKLEKRPTRTERRPRYMITGFSSSVHFGLEHGNEDEKTKPPHAVLAPTSTDPTLPELADPTRLYDPFPIDVFCLGNLLRMEFIDGNTRNLFQNGRYGFDFLRPLVDAMTKPDPRARVTMAEALKMLDNIIKKTGCYKLRSRSRLVPGRYAPQTKFLDTVKERVHHWRTTIAYIARGLPAVPADP